MAGKEVTQRRLYKYLDATGGLSLLSTRELMFTNATQMNDPFDCHPALIDFSKVPKEKCINWPPELVELLESDRFRRYRESAWLCCLSKQYDSLLMWSYYNKHQGVCIGLNMEKMRKYLSQMYGINSAGCYEWEVQYKDIIKKPDYFKDITDFFHYQLSTKAKVWEHEEEVRLCSLDPSVEFMKLMPGQTDKDGPIKWETVHAFLEIGRECFESLYLGINMDPKQEKKIVKVARECNPEIEVYKMTVDPNAFRLKEDIIQ